MNTLGVQDSRGRGGFGRDPVGWMPIVMIAILLVHLIDLLDETILQLAFLPRPGEPMRNWFTWTVVGALIVLASLVTRQYRRQMRQLRANHEEFRALAHLAPVGIFRTGAGGECDYVNGRWTKVTGMTLDRARGHGWVDALHPEDRERVGHAWYEAARLDREFRDEYRFQRPDGTVTWVAGAALALRESSGAVAGYLGTVTDITALKDSEARLREAAKMQADAAAREKLLRRELDHRVRNNLTSILGLLRIREHDANTKADAIAAIRSAVQAFERAHDLMSTAQGEVTVTLLVWQLAQTLAPLEAHSRITVRGDHAVLSRDSIGPMSMIIQELVTNSIKHGALRDADGRVVIDSMSMPGEREGLRFIWDEPGRPGVQPDEMVEGTGMTIVRTLVERELGGRLNVHTRGEFRVEINVELRSHERGRSPQAEDRGGT